MKLVTFAESTGSPQLGAVVGNKIVNLHQLSGGQLPDNMQDFLGAGDSAMESARTLLPHCSDETDMSQLRLLAPVTHPSKIVAIGLNYRDHVEEAGLPFPSIATMFCKYPSSIIGPEDEIRWSNKVTQKVDYEAELAIVIGKTARNVLEDDAYDYIAGYTNCNDVSARDLQLETGDQWLRGKCLDSFCPLGPFLVTRDEIADPHNLSIKCLVNAEVRQNSNTRELIYKIPFLINYLTAAFTLNPGDVIITGTPPGVGAFQKPPIWLKQGDSVTVEIEGLGRLTNRCMETD